MRRNLGPLLLLLVGCALAARFLHPASRDPERERARVHLQTCLNVFWGTPNNAVQLVTGSEGGLEAWVTAFSPPGTSPQAERWNFALLQFVARRHPGIQLDQLNITNGTTGLRLQLASNDEAGAAPPRVELLRRQTQALVDGSLGNGRGLLLLSGIEESLPNGPQSGPGGRANRAMKVKARPAPSDDGPGAGAPALERDSAGRPAYFVQTVPKILEECLVVGPEPSEQQLQTLQAQIRAQIPCDRFRVVRLPAP